MGRTRTRDVLIRLSAIGMYSNGLSRVCHGQAVSLAQWHREMLQLCYQDSQICEYLTARIVGRTGEQVSVLSCC